MLKRIIKVSIMGPNYRCYCIIICAIALSIAQCSLLNSASNKVVQLYHNVEINWTDQLITAKASSMPSITDDGTPVDRNTLETISINYARSRSIDEARDSAIESLINALGIIKIDPYRTLGDCIAGDDYTQKQLGLLTTDIKVRLKPDGTLATQCIATFPMGRLLKLIPEALPSRDIPALPIKLPATDYTGLIIDTRGLKHTPMIFPSIFSEDGTEIFGKDFIDSRDAYRYGTVAYCYTDDTALRHKKAGKLPYYCAAVRLYNACPVIANPDLRKIIASNNTRNNLKKGNII
ncbi:MAG TPA: hypothetical protein P5547_10615, partial [Spirochaetota bacterium]|nr:hypothetical protein [Spirochaetota bacterium]